MDHSEILYLLSQLRYREFRELAENKRLIKSACKNGPGSRSSGAKINEWIRAHLPEKSNREDRPLEQGRISNPCCRETES